MTAAALHRPRAGVRQAGASLSGAGTLLRFMLHRDRIRLPGWTIGLALLMGPSCAGATGGTSPRLVAVPA
ncbi:hypothetical protein AB0I61_31980 [Polymorphospora rubra]|uniref:hypothetical protein n=1 Tax=Polymorphospora rubra TaxID=338584 RepID=UPI0033EC05A3